MISRVVCTGCWFGTHFQLCKIHIDTSLLLLISTQFERAETSGSTVPYIYPVRSRGSKFNLATYLPDGIWCMDQKNQKSSVGCIDSDVFFGRVGIGRRQECKFFLVISSVTQKMCKRGRLWTFNHKSYILYYIRCLFFKWFLGSPVGVYWFLVHFQPTNLNWKISELLKDMAN